MSLKNTKPIILSLSILLSSFSAKASLEFETPLGKDDCARSLFYEFSGRGTSFLW